MTNKRRPRRTTGTPKPYSLRINNLRDEMARLDLDGYLVWSRMDQYWLTGFTGEDGGVLLTAKQVALLTDGRFDEAASREAPYAHKVLRKRRNPEATAKEVKRARIKRLGYDPDVLTVSEFVALRKLCKPTTLVPAGGIFNPLRAIKDAGEVARIRGAIRIAEKAFQNLRRWLKPGVTEREAAAKLVYEMQKLGAQGETFPSIVAFGPNSSLPHAVPGDRKLARNEVLLFDWGAHVDFYGSDLTRVLCLGKLPPKLCKIYDVVRAAHDAAMDAVRPGMTAHELDSVARKVITKAGYGKLFNHALGHGLGLVAHEMPRVGIGTQIVLQPGMVITIEPGVYVPGLGGIRLEDDVLVTRTGCEPLTTLPLELA